MTKMNAGEVEIRTARLLDVPSIIFLECQTGRTQLDPLALEAAVKDENRHVAVAILGATVVGWGKTHYWDYSDGDAPSGHYLGGVSVLSSQRRRGVGSAITEARLQWIWSREPEAWYVVNAGNTPSIELHRRWHFTEVARGPQFHTTTFTGGVGLLMSAKRP
ncbi:GNAT family N-acetyltransferase [Paenarthrobacter sp. NPDC056912]|uniref:GNAT family N-acetyltransferase n=1 Tax=Paenarthrobacter sp. NPDC056912 TaxID=3345965 RepID=UPI0036710C9B